MWIPSLKNKKAQTTLTNRKIGKIAIKQAVLTNIVGLVTICLALVRPNHGHQLKQTQWC